MRVGVYYDGRVVELDASKGLYSVGGLTVALPSVTSYDRDGKIQWDSPSHRDELWSRAGEPAPPPAPAWATKAAQAKKSQSLAAVILVGVILTLCVVVGVAISGTRTPDPYAPSVQAPEAPSPAAPELTPEQLAQGTLTPTDPAPEAEQSGAEQSVEYGLAYLDSKGSAQEGDLSVKRFRYLLDEIGSATGEKDERIADMTVKGQQILLTKYGRETTLLALMEQANKAVVPNTSDAYAHAVADTVQRLGTE